MFTNSAILWICWYSYSCLFPLHSNRCKGWKSVMMRRLLFSNICFCQMDGQIFHMVLFRHFSTPPQAFLLHEVMQIFACLNKHWLHFRLTGVDFIPNFICWQEDCSLFCLTFSYLCSSSQIMYFRLPPEQENTLTFSHPRFFSESSWTLTEHYCMFGWG